jgi:uncharacterized membrane protein
LAPIDDANGPESDIASARWPLLCTLAGCGVGAAFFAVGVQSGLLPTADQAGVAELVVGALVYGLLLGLTVGQLAQSAHRERKVPWLVLVASVVGAAVGAILGYAIVRELFGAVWTGLGGALAGGFLGNKLSSRRTKALRLTEPA